MTTSQSPLRVLKSQASLVARTLKAAVRGEVVEGPFGEKIKEARDRPTLVFGVAMDDKFLKIEMTWDVIHETSEVGLAEYILREMRGSRDTVQ